MWLVLLLMRRQPGCVCGDSPADASEIVTRVLDEGVYFSQRIIEDRVRNPHGEEAEVSGHDV